MTPTLKRRRLGLNRPRTCQQPARDEWRLHITKRRQRAFKMVGLTWVVERGSCRNRRFSNDYELKVQTSEVFIDLDAIHLMLKRLTPRNTV